MQDTDSLPTATLENQITEHYGLLLSQTQLAEPLGCRIYDPTTEVAGLIKGTSNE